MPTPSPYQSDHSEYGMSAMTNCSQVCVVAIVEQASLFLVLSVSALHVHNCKRTQHPASDASRSALSLRILREAAQRGVVNIIFTI